MGKKTRRHTDWGGLGKAVKRFKPLKGGDLHGEGGGVDLGMFVRRRNRCAKELLATISQTFPQNMHGGKKNLL